MSFEVLIVLLAIPIGIIAGMMPGIPTSVVLILTFPLINNLPFNLLISFYICVAICTQFSNSVIALYAGIPGDLTALPILKERKTLLSNFSLKENLVRTAIASVIGTSIGFLLLMILVLFFMEYSVFLLRTEILFSVIVFIIIICLFWKTNYRVVNLFLVFIGCILGITGYNSVLLKDFFTFGISYLYSGLPVLPAFIALYAIPSLLELNSDKKSYSIETPGISEKKKNYKTYYSAILGSIIGSIVGLIPLLGSYSSSNVAYWTSKYFRLSPLERVISSESSNSAAFVIVLAPLLTFGIAIVPSEIILLELLKYNNWSLAYVTKETLYVLFLFSVAAVFFGFCACTTLAKYFVHFIIKSGPWMPIIILIFLILNMYIIGTQSASKEIYLITFACCSVASFVFYKMHIDPMPLIFSWALGEQFLITGQRLISLYF